MRTDGYQGCIVTLIDLIGIKGIAGSGMGSPMMMAMHQQVIAKVNSGDLPSHPYVYLWNDSILLLAYLDDVTPRKSLKNRILREANALKRDIDGHVEQGTYAISA